MKNLLKKVYTKEYFIFLIIAYLPLLYKICQIALLSSFVDAMNILGQMTLIGIIFKCLQETLINPLFKTLGKNDNTEESKNYYAKKFLAIYSLIVAIFTILIFFLLKPIMQASKIPQSIFDQTYIFLQMMVFVNGLKIIIQYLFTFNMISKNNKNLFIYLLISAIATLVLDLIFIPKWILGLGVYGVAITSLVVNVVLFLYLIFTMPKQKKVEGKFNQKGYFKLVLFSFLETTIRNVVYYCVILVFFNIINNQDLYYVSNDFIWSIMIVPALAQNNIIKQSLSHNNQESLKPYFCNNILIIIYMCMMTLVAFILFKYAYQFENYMEYFTTFLKIAPCYIIFIFDNVIESYFISVGKMHHVLIQNLITNILVYLTAFVLYLCGVWVITLDSLIAVFSAGMIFSSIYTISVYIIEKLQSKKKEIESIEKVDSNETEEEKC